MEQIHLSKEEMTEEELEKYLAYKKWSMNRLLKMFPKEGSTLQNSNNLNKKQKSTKKDNLIATKRQIINTIKG